MSVSQDATVPNVENIGNTSRLKQAQEAVVDFIKSLLNHLIAQYTAFKNQIVSFVLFKIRYDDLNISGWTMEAYARRIEVLNKKKKCLASMLEGKSTNKMLLRDFDSFVKLKDVQGHKRMKSFYSLIEHCKTILKKKLMFYEDRLIHEEDKENINARKNFAKDTVVLFQEMTKKVDAISDQKHTLENRIIKKQEENFEKEWNSLNDELSAEKTKAQKYYNEKLKDISKEFRNWSKMTADKQIEHNIFEEELEFQNAMILLLHIEKENIKKIENGKSSSLDLIVTQLDLNEDRDMEIFRLHPNNLPEELLRLKIQNIEKDIEDLTKNMNVFELDAKEKVE